MLGRRVRSVLRLAAGLGLLGGYPGSARAVDGVIEINQTRALAGGVTGSDGPGFPVTLDAAGSYRLTSNLDITGEANPENVTVIQLTADEITLDLNGFAILGTNTCSGIPTSCNANGSGVGIDGNTGLAEGVTVKNGTIRGTGAHAIDLLGGSHVEGMFITEVGGYGIFTGSTSTVIVNRLLQIGGALGISVGGSSTIRDNTVVSPAGTGIRAASAACTVVGNSVSGGTIGIHAANSVVRDNTVRFASGFGMELIGSSSGYVNNVLTNNNGGDASLQLSGGLQMGTNICGGSTLCP